LNDKNLIYLSHAYVKINDKYGADITGVHDHEYFMNKYFTKTRKEVKEIMPADVHKYASIAGANDITDEFLSNYIMIYLKDFKL
jgi:hypothetical protein